MSKHLSYFIANQSQYIKISFPQLIKHDVNETGELQLELTKNAREPLHVLIRRDSPGALEDVSARFVQVLEGHREGQGPPLHPLDASLLPYNPAIANVPDLVATITAHMIMVIAHQRRPYPHLLSLFPK